MVKNGYACELCIDIQKNIWMMQKYAKANKLGIWKMKYNISWENKCRRKINNL